MAKYQSGNFRVCSFEKVLEQFRKLLMITVLVTGEEELPRVISMMILRMMMIVFCVTIVVENSMRMQQQDT
jgi:hypothetical protein